MRKSPKVDNCQTFVTLRGAMGSYLWARATSPPSALRGLLTDSCIMFCICHCSNTTQFLCIMFCIYHNLICVLPLCDSVVLISDLRSQSPTLDCEKVKSMTKTHQNLRLKLHKGTPPGTPQSRGHVWLQKVTVSDSRRLSEQLCDRHNAGYSCGQSKSSNLLTDFLELRKASELVDNGINEFLLMSFINSSKQNFQK